jgi:hypothetical protein
MHFSDKLSYKILCISSYSLKDMNYTRFTYLQEFQKTERGKKTVRAELGRTLLASENNRPRGGETAMNNLGPRPIWRRICTKRNKKDEAFA